MILKTWSAVNYPFAHDTENMECCELPISAWHWKHGVLFFFFGQFNCWHHGLRCTEFILYGTCGNCGPLWSFEIDRSF